MNEKPTKEQIKKFIIWLIGVAFFCIYGVISFYLDVYHFIITHWIK